MARFLDGARVLFVADGHYGEGLDGSEIVELAIAKYDDVNNPDAIYLFAVNANGIVIGDLLYPTVAEAKKDAKRFYDCADIEWKQVL